MIGRSVTIGIAAVSAVSRGIRICTISIVVVRISLGISRSVGISLTLHNMDSSESVVKTSIAIGVAVHTSGVSDGMSNRFDSNFGGLLNNRLDNWDV